MANVYRKILEDNDTVTLPFPASTAVEIGDLLWWDDTANTAKRASAQADQLTEGLNQAEFADKFAGVALQQRLSTETTTGENSKRVIATDGVFEFVSPSTTWEIGDMIGASEDSAGTALLNQQVERVTDPGRAIGICVERTTAAATTVKCRLISSWARDHEFLRAHRFSTREQASYVYSAPADEVFFVAGRAYRVKYITGRVIVAGTDAGAVTGQVRKVPTATAPSAGTLLHTGTFNLKGTVDANQALTLSTTASDIELASGDGLALDVTGVTTAARGIVSVGLTPI